MKKQCTKCQEFKGLRAFNRSKLGKYNRKSQCRNCAKVYNKNRRRLNLKQYLQTYVLRKKSTLLWFDNLRSTLQCIQCGMSHPGALQFHHRDPSKKKYMISVMVSQCYTQKRILKEIEKCDVLCANCHSIYHFNQRRVN